MSVRNWSADRPSSRASPLPQFDRWASARNWSAGRPPSRASSLPQKSKGRSAYPHAPHHSSGRALARLQLLILIHPPPRQAERRRSSGGGRAAPFDAVEHIERRSKRSRPEAMPPEEGRSEGTPSLSEGPYVRGETFGYFGAFAKVTRCKSGTISRRYRRNGYVLDHPRAWSAQRPPRPSPLGRCSRPEPEQESIALPAQPKGPVR